METPSEPIGRERLILLPVSDEMMRAYAGGPTAIRPKHKHHQASHAPKPAYEVLPSRINDMDPGTGDEPFIEWDTHNLSTDA